MIEDQSRGRFCLEETSGGLDDSVQQRAIRRFADGIGDDVRQLQKLAEGFEAVRRLCLAAQILDFHSLCGDGGMRALQRTLDVLLSHGSTPLSTSGVPPGRYSRCS